MSGINCPKCGGEFGRERSEGVTYYFCVPCGWRVPSKVLIKHGLLQSPKDKVAAYQRAYYEKNKDKVAARKAEVA